MIRSLKIITAILIIQLSVVSSSYGQDREVKDCFEKINRATFAFNMALDKVLFRPVAAGYRKLPSPVRAGTSNALNNLSNLVTIPNNILQGDFRSAGNNTIRLIINTTIGIVGIFDPANALGFEKLDKEDFGQTLGFWGVPDGPYLVLPFLGPSSFRDGPSMIVDYELSPVEQLHHEERQVLQTLDIVDTRARLLRATKILDTAAKDKYIFIRESYLQKRESQVNDGNVKEEFEIDVHSVDY